MQIIFNVILNTLIIGLVALSFSLPYYVARMFHIAHAGIIALAEYFMSFFFRELSIPFLPAVMLAVLAAVAAGLLCELSVYRFMRRRKMPAMAYLIASIGLYVVLQNCISIFFGDDARMINSGEVMKGFPFIGAYITSFQMAAVLISGLLLLFVNLLLQFTVTGKSIRAVASNPELCDLYGISADRIILVAFGAGSALGAVAGILYAMEAGMTPGFGFNLLLYGVVALIIGGVGSTKGLLAGSLLVAASRNLAAYYMDTRWMDVVTYIILILFLIWKPLGFSGKRLKKTEV